MKRKKLVLKKETLRSLRDGHLVKAAGGGSQAPDSCDPCWWETLSCISDCFCTETIEICPA